jgi:hypothetical protein
MSACTCGGGGAAARAYRPDPSSNWVKIKNPKHPAMKRVKEAFA